VGSFSLCSNQSQSLGVITPKEQVMAFKKYFLIGLFFLLSACATATRPIPFQETNIITQEIYLQKKVNTSVVLLDVNWGRWWNCGGYENAQLISLAFDKLPMKRFENEIEPSLVLNSPSRLMVDPVFQNYAFLLEPGEYCISAISIKVADSMSKVGFLTEQRDRLFTEGKPVGGTFIVKPDEAVFIGNFYLDCAYGPTLWRYYPEGKEAFGAQVKEYQNSFPFIELNNVNFRLFKTKVFGIDYKLEP